MANDYFRGVLSNRNWPSFESLAAKNLRGQGWHNFRKFMFQLRGRYCECCKLPGAYKWLQLHHIKRIAEYRHLRFEPSNIIICCNDCHSMLEWIGEETVRLSSGGSVDSACKPTDAKSVSSPLIPGVLLGKQFKTPLRGEGPRTCR